MYEPEPWIQRSGPKIREQLWTLRDKSEREGVLIPEATAIIQDLYDRSWSKSRPKPIRIFYVTRCFRYERPQRGRYREFTQFGVEILGPDPASYEDEAKDTLRACLDDTRIPYEWTNDAVRGLSYYTRGGFEAACPSLGAQKQIAGGGVYRQGCGWAIGMDRLTLAGIDAGVS